MATRRAWAPPANPPRPPPVLLSSRHHRRRRHWAKPWGAAAVSLSQRPVGGGGAGRLLRRCSGPRWPRTPTTAGGQWWRRQAQAGPILAPMGLDGSCPDLLVFLDSDNVPGSSWVPLAARGHLGHLSWVWWWWPSPPSEVAGRQWLI
jgi:hypothetical protein